MTMEGDQVPRNFVEYQYVPFQPIEERRSTGPPRSTGPQDGERRAIRGASPPRLAELTQREEEALQQVAEFKRREREARRRQRETIRWTKEEERRRQRTEAIQQNREEEARRREELAEHTSQGRQRARRERQELDSSSPEYGIVFSYTRTLSAALGD
jgi:hypothetical protein